jgi:hypothetical protein
MTGFATGGLEISRATVGTLEDMGYVVDYCGADAFPVSNLGASCVCSSIQADGGGGDSTIIQPDDSSGKLSDAGRLTASEFGRQYLKNRSAEREESAADEDGIIYLGDVVIVYVEEGAIYEVHVTSDDLL